MKLDYIRGHMGGNLIILLKGHQLPPGRELEITAKVMGPNYLHAHDGGILYPGKEAGHLGLRMVEPNVPTYITACGGLSQVLGRALLQTDLASEYGLTIVPGGISPVILDTDGGPTLLEIDSSDYENPKCKIHLQSFARECIDRGLAPLVAGGVPVMRSGKFLIIQGDDVKALYPQVDFLRWNAPTRELVAKIQDDFMAQTGEIEPSVTVYDWNPQNRGNGRVVFPHAIRKNFIEPSCGTGTVAMALAARLRGEAGSLGDCIALESGGDYELGGPDLSWVEFDSKNPENVIFYHSTVEITSIGQVWV